jgi:transcriptional regulator with XRE-family HTH domain
MTSRESAAAGATEQGLGARLRALREQRGISARALALTLGISASAVSQIERDVMRPSVARLIAITDALGIPLAEVFDDDQDHADQPNRIAELANAGFALTRSWQSSPVELESGVRFRRLSPHHTHGLDFFESTYPPGSAAHPASDLFRHEGYEIGTVTHGELTIDFDDERVILGVGDSISYPCDRAHRIHNTSDAVAVATWLIVHT